MLTAVRTAGARQRPVTSLLRWHLIRLVGVTLLLAVPGLTTAVLARTQAQYYQTSIAPNRDAITTLYGDLTASLAAYDAFLTSGNPDEAARFARSRDDYVAILERQAAGQGGGSAERVATLRGAGDRWFAAADAVMGRVRARQPADASAASEAYARAVTAAKTTAEDSARARDEWWVLHDRTLTIGIAATLVAAALAAVLGWGVIRSTQRAFSAPLRELAAVVRAYDRGDWSARVGVLDGPTEVVDVAHALNRLAASELVAQRERDLSLRMLAMTSEVVSELAVAPSQAGHWSPACGFLGQALGADRVVLNTWENGRFVPLGSWAAPGTPPVEFFLPDVRGAVAERVLVRTRVAGTPEEIAQRFPGEVVELIVGHGGRAWVLEPLRVGDAIVGVLSVWCRTERHWQRVELEAVERCAFAAAQTVAETRQLSRLHDLERQKTAFLATTSHELRTPLTSISGYLELLTDGEFGDVDPEQAHALAVVERNVRRLRALVDDLLILSGLDSGRAVTNRERVPIDAVVREALADVRAAAQTAGVLIEYAGIADDGAPSGGPGGGPGSGPGSGPAHSDVAAVTGVHDQLVRAVRSVVGNAVKFAPAASVVSVAVALTGQETVVTCRDGGIGIPADELDLVFSRFYRASNAAQRETPGTGLGLAITRAVIEQHGGRVHVASVEGGGTTVTMHLPLASTEPATASA